MTEHQAGATLVYSTASYDYLLERILSCCSSHSIAMERGQLERRFFPDGEKYFRLCQPVEGRAALLIGGTISDTETLELYDIASALCKYGASHLTIAVPYYGYSTMERAVQFGEIVTAKSRARLLSSIPIASHGNRILLLDLHAEGLQYYFEGALTSKHLYGKSAITSAIKAKYPNDDFVLGSTDAGRAKWVQSLANEMSAPAALVLKRRVSGSSTEVVAINAQVQGLNVALYDDMIRTGGTLLKAAEAYRNAGARSVSAFATHGVLPEGALTKLRLSGLLDQVICTDSHPNAVKQENDFLKVISIADILVSGLNAGF